MIELLLPSGIIGSLFFMFWLVKFPQEVYRTMAFKDGEILWGLCTWLFFTLLIGAIAFITSIAIQQIVRDPVSRNEVLSGEKMRVNPRIYRQSQFPIVRTKEQHLDLYRGLRDEDGALSLKKYAYHYGVDSGDLKWIRKELARIDADHKLEINC